jgi:hypothetical protein
LKKVFAIGFAVVFAVVIILLWLHFKHPGEQQIQREFAGAWTNLSQIGSRTETSTLVCASDGSYRRHWTATAAGKTSGGTEDGTWQIKDGFLIITMTSNDVDMQIPPPSTNRIIRIDSQEFALQGARNGQMVFRKITP